MKNIKNLSDDTIVEVAVPKALYETIKKQMAKKLEEAKQNFGAGYTPIKEKKSAAPTKASKPTEESTEKTLEERVAALEEMLKSMKEGEKKEENYMGTQYASSEDMAVDMVKKGITREEKKDVSKEEKEG